MTTSAESSGSMPGQQLSSNNPYKSPDGPTSAASGLEVDTAKEQQQSLDSEKQVVNIEDSAALNSPMVVNQEGSAALNSPMVVEKEETPRPKPQPEREAGKEVFDSWQTKSREESAPIPLYQEHSNLFHGDLMNDMKGEPPSYDSLNRQSRGDGNDPSLTQTTIEPDDSGANLPPRPEDRSAVGQLLSWMPPPPSKPVSQMPPLLQPVIIPQLDVPPQGESVPFERCYSAALLSRGVSMREFTSFLDGLAVAQAPKSALQGLKMFGAGVAALPLPIIPLAGRGISALATSGSGHSGSRARLYLERTKKEYFEPRGLRLSVIKDPDLNPRLQIPAHAHRLAPLTSSTLTENISKRRLEGLAPYVAPLTFNVPEQDKQTQGVHKMARKNLEGKFKNQGRILTRMREDQWRNITHSGIRAPDWDSRYKDKMTQLAQLQNDMAREQRSGKGQTSTLREMMQALDQMQKDIQLLASERQMAMQNAIDGHRGVEAEMEETNWSRKLKWIVIENLQ